MSVSDWAFEYGEWLFGNVVMPLCLLLVTLFILAIPFLIYGCIQESKRPTFELKKGDWECTDTRTVTSTYYINVNNVMVPQTSSHEECIQWSRR